MLPPMLSCLSLALLCLFLVISPAAAQDQEAQVWAVFAYTVYGDIIPHALPRPRALTPYGANQLHDAGSAFRDRYVALTSDTSGPSTRIENLSPYLLDNDDIKVAATPDVAVLASAQAFMQGLYPPLDEAFNSTFFDHNMQMANGSVTSAPLGGYQYPSIVTFGLDDPQSITIAGKNLCPAHAYANAEYIGSQEFWQTYEESAVFYNHLYTQALSEEFESSATNYANATSISEFLDYQSGHNQSLSHNLSPEDIKRARWYASKYVFETNGKTSAAASVANIGARTIAGQGLASSVSNAFDTSIQARGAEGKMTLLFGGFETAVSFASLLRITDMQNADFFPLPNLGASIVLELYSLESEAYPTYPDPSQLYVRFFLRNGTDAEFRTYPLFGYSPSKTAVPFQEFQAELQKISLVSPADWCRKCNSSAVFCTGVMNRGQDRDRGDGRDGSGISPAVAGVIGAVITIVLLALLAVFGFLAHSLRTKRMRKPSLGGFKGDSKMVSDSDVTFKNPEWKDDIVKLPGATARGYERHGSWEMTNHTRTPPVIAEQDVGSSFADQIEEEWQLHSEIEPAKVREHV